MANIKDNLAIKIYNYNPFNLSVTSNVKTYMLKPCYDDVPAFATVTFSELDYINSVSASIRNGMISIDKEVANNVYKALGIADFENIMTNEIIKDILINPNKEKLSKLVSITDDSVINRVNAIYRGLINQGNEDISNRVMNIVETKIDETRKGILSSRIKIVSNDDAIPNPNEDISSVKAQNLELQEQMKQMQEMMAQLLANQKTVETTEVKKTGRPAKTKSE